MTLGSNRLNISQVLSEIGEGDESAAQAPRICNELPAEVDSETQSFNPKIVRIPLR